MDVQTLPIRYELSTGRPEDALEGLRRAVAQYARDARGFRIGRTSSPESRWTSEYQDIYSEMVVIYETSSQDHVAEVEAALIEFFADDADNDQEGSSGPWGEPPYYGYVVLD